MAAAFLNHLSQCEVEVRSASSAPADQAKPAAARAMAEVGIDIAAETPKILTDRAVREGQVSPQPESVWHWDVSESELHVPRRSRGRHVEKWIGLTWEYAIRHWRMLAVTAMLDIALALLAVAAPWPLKLAVDQVLSQRAAPAWAAWALEPMERTSPVIALVVLALLSVCLVVAIAVVGGLQKIIRRAAGQRMSGSLALDVLDKLQHASVVQQSARPTGDLMQRTLADTKCVETMVFGVVFTLFQATASLVAMAVVMSQLHAGLTVLAIALALPMFGVAHFFSGRMARSAVDQAQALSRVMTGAEHMLSAVPEIQSHAAESAELLRFRSIVAGQVKAGTGVQRVSFLYQQALGTVTGVGTSVVLLVGGLAALRGSLTVGDLIVFSAYVAALYSPLEATASVAQATASAKAGAQRVLEVLETDDELPQPVHPVRLPVGRDASGVVFEDVWFGYEQGQPVLRGVSLEVEPGQTVALVGRTGAGKSTLLSLVPRFMDPWSGVVRIGGVDVRTAALQDVRRRVSLVRQEPLLLPVSIAENIAYGRPGASRAQVERAAEEALAAEFIERLPAGYDTIVGERGATLSGGQRQRLAIARALLKDAPVLILDEPTAALDAESEAHLVEALARASRTRTVLVIAHRLSTVRRADSIAVVENGTIIEQGTHTQLLSTAGTYARYHQLTLRSTPAPGAVSGKLP
jgi:ATP-binding cassette subfamily B protein/subfamily B ATP-binding cassette protein MsbA